MRLTDHRHSNRAMPDYGAVFSAGLLDPELATPDGVTGPLGKAATRRYNVYRNNVTVSLIEVLGSIYPAVQRITGSEFFRAMARFYVRANPPSSALLFEYGREFSDFIAKYEYAQSVPWLADIARIERAWLDCYHAADAEPLSTAVLGSVPPDKLADLVFVPHPAVRIVCSRFSAVSIFAAYRDQRRPAPDHATVAEDALISRPGPDVAVRHLPAGAAAFLTRLIEGAPLGVAVSAALEAAPNFDLPANIAGMIDAGVFTTIKNGDPRW
ncbi:DNA-binding domain-containing protein [Bradyrhizobium genosp. P]|uniref:HvfC/BufC N-terminal domain-containing protein n=1 Tax=Bradyrhizobium genosp. P TaxID=83641 RepID=UPI003CEF8808